MTVPDPPVLLIHGFAVDARAMWEETGWTRALERAGRRWIAPDLLGHGTAAKPHDPVAYAGQALLDHVWASVGEAELVDVVGYSLGAELALDLALGHPGQVRRLVVGGVGTARALTPAQADALLAAVRDGTALPPGRPSALWAFAGALPGNDPLALAACLAGVSRTPRLRAANRFAGSALLFAGADDELAEGIETLAAALPGGELLRLPGRDHRTAITAGMARRRAVALLSDPAA